MQESLGIYQGNLNPAYDSDAMRHFLAHIKDALAAPQVARLSNGPDYVVRTQLEGELTLDITIKVFKRQSWLKNWYDKKIGSKAARSYQAACYLEQHGINTASPIAFLDRWENGRLLESYFVSLFTPGDSFRDH